MTRLLYAIIISIAVIVVSCKKESQQPSAGTGVAGPPYTVTDYPHQIGDTCYYTIKKTQTETYYDGTPPNIYHMTASNYLTLLADSTLPNGTIGKIWYLSSCSIMGGYKQLVYFDSTLACNVFKPVGTVYYVYPLMIQMPLQQNTTWPNTVNAPNDTCKALNYELYNIGTKLYNVINVKRRFNNTVTGTSWSFDYKIGNTGIIHTLQVESTVYSTFDHTIEIEITLDHTNF
jgi:hypothetical protein